MTGSSGGSSSTGSEQVTAGLLTLPGGRILVALVGLVVLVVAGAMGYTGVARNFSDDLDYGRLPDRLRRPVEVLGVAGHLARAVAFAIVGVLFEVAALLATPAARAGSTRHSPRSPSSRTAHRSCSSSARASRPSGSTPSPNPGPDASEAHL